MIKQLKIYEIEDTFNLPKVDFDDWSNPVSVELAKNGFDFLSRLSLYVNKLYRLSDLVENKHEIISASKIKFSNNETNLYINSIFKLYSLCDHLIEFSDFEDSEDIVVVSHRKKGNRNFICLFILNKIMNIVLSEKEIIENLSKELISFDYKGIANIILSEEKIFDFNELNLIKDELTHALKYKFLSKKTMSVVSFLNTLRNNSYYTNKEVILIMDILKIKV